MAGDSRAVDWSRRALEGFVIVGSILLAFAIDAMWDGYQADGQRRQFVAALAEDMAWNRQELISSIARNDQSLRLMQVFLDTRPETLATLPSDSAAVIAGSLSALRTFSPRESAIRGGGVGFVQDRELRDAIGLWSGQVAELLETRQAIILAVGETYLARGVEFFELRALGDEAAYPGGLRILRSEPDMFYAVELKSRLQAVELRKTRDLLETVERILDLIQATPI